MKNWGSSSTISRALVQLAQSGNHRQRPGKQLLSALTEHLGAPAEGMAVVEEKIPPHRFVDADIVMAWARSAGPRKPARGHRRRWPAAPPVAERHGPAVAALSAVSARPARLREPGGGTGHPAAGRGPGPLAVQLRRQPAGRAAARRRAPVRPAVRVPRSAGGQPGNSHGVPDRIPDAGWTAAASSKAR